MEKMQNNTEQNVWVMTLLTFNHESKITSSFPFLLVNNTQYATAVCIYVLSAHGPLRTVSSRMKPYFEGESLSFFYWLPEAKLLRIKQMQTVWQERCYVDGKFKQNRWFLTSRESQKHLVIEGPKDA